MPRCTETNKFASYDEPEAELSSSDIAGSTYTAEIHVNRPCAECGEEMASYDFSIEQDLECPTCGTECGGHYGTERLLPDSSPDHEGGVLPSDKLPEDHEDYNLLEIEFTIEDEGDPEVDESGGGRYKKNIFTASIHATIQCGCCEETFEIDASDTAAASDFEVLV